MSEDGANLEQVDPALAGWAVRPLARDAEARVRAALERAGFDVRVLDGRRARDEAGFFAAIAEALNLPEHFGHNWDALQDGLVDLMVPGVRLALLWHDADASLAAALPVVLAAVQLFAVTALETGEPDSAQLYVYLFGDGPGFPTPEA